MKQKLANGRKLTAIGWFDMGSRKQFEKTMAEDLGLAEHWFTRSTLNPDKYGITTVQWNWEVWQASRKSIALPLPCPEKTPGPNPLRSNYAVGWDECLMEVAKRIGAPK